MSERTEAPKTVILCPYWEGGVIWWGEDFSEQDCEEYGSTCLDENGEDLDEPIENWCNLVNKPCAAKRYKLVELKEAADAVRDEDK